MDPQLWERTGGDPVRLSADVSVKRLEALSIDKRFIKNLRLIEADLRLSDRRSLVSGVCHENPAAPVSIGCFSPEFGITEVRTQVASASSPVII